MELDVIVSEPTTKERLSELMNKLYASIQARRGFKHHRAPTHIAVSIYRTKYNAESGQAQWMVRLIKSANAAPQLLFKEEEIELSKRPPAKRFGLTEDERMAIWKQLVLIERKARDRTEAKYPDMYNYGKMTTDSYHRSREFEKKLTDQYESKLARSLGLTKEELDQISG